MRLVVGPPFPCETQQAALHLLEDDGGVGEENTAVSLVLLARLPRLDHLQVRHLNLFNSHLSTNSPSAFKSIRMPI